MKRLPLVIQMSKHRPNSKSKSAWYQLFDKNKAEVGIMLPNATYKF